MGWFLFMKGIEQSIFTSVQAVILFWDLFLFCPGCLQVENVQNVLEK